jgi:hypothetical protein
MGNGIGEEQDFTVDVVNHAKFTINLKIVHVIFDKA